MASSSPAALGRPRPATEVLFDRICRENGITHRLTGVRSSTTTGKIERFHQSLRVELLDDHLPFADLAAEQAAIDAWRHHDNTARPHQSLGMATPASRFRPAPADGLPLRLPAGLVPVIEPAAEPARTRLAIASSAPAGGAEHGPRRAPPPGDVHGSPATQLQSTSINRYPREPPRRDRERLTSGRIRSVMGYLELA